MSEPNRQHDSAPSSAAIELVIGGKYRIEALLGEGGFARVYRARHVRIRKLEYAIKVLKQRQLNANEAVERFVREAEMSAALQSPYVVRTSDFGETAAGLPYIVMEFVFGVTVHDYVKKHGRMRPIEVARVAACVLRGLEEAHSKGIVHRDLKPSNIMLLVEPADDVIAKVTDFGIAKVVDDSTTGLEPSPQTTGGVVFCTPQYAGPEVLMGEPNTQSDIYALGHTMAEMLDGVSPFAGVGGFEVASLQMKQEMTRFGALTRASELYPIIAKASAKELKQRYATATEMLADVDQAIVQLARRSVSLMRPMRVTEGLNPKTGSVRGLREGVLDDFGAEVLAGNPDAGTRPAFANQSAPPPPVASVGEFDFEPVSSGQLVPAEVAALRANAAAATDPKVTVAASVAADEVRRSGTSDAIASLPGSVPASELSREASRASPAHSLKATGEDAVSFSGEGRVLTAPKAAQRTVLAPIAALSAMQAASSGGDGVTQVSAGTSTEARRAYLVALVAMGIALLVAIGALMIVLARPLPTSQLAPTRAPAPLRVAERVERPAIPPVDPVALDRAVAAAQIRVFAARTAPPPGRQPIRTEPGEAEAIAAGYISQTLVSITPFPVDVAGVAAANVGFVRPQRRANTEAVGPTGDAVAPRSTADAPPEPATGEPAAGGTAPLPAPAPTDSRPLWDEPRPIIPQPTPVILPTDADATEEQRRRNGVRFNTRRIE